jgi:hypothetical protein
VEVWRCRVCTVEAKRELYVQYIPVRMWGVARGFCFGFWEKEDDVVSSDAMSDVE